MPATPKTGVIKIPQIARWRIAGISDPKIADLMGMSASGLARILATVEYKEYEAALLSGHLTSMDAALAGKVKAIHDEFKQAVPAALRCLVDAVTQRRDLKAALAAASEILDRDPDNTLPKKRTIDEDDMHKDHVPAEVLDAAVKLNNDIVESYEKDAKTRLN